MKNILCIVFILWAYVAWGQENYIDLVWSDEFNADGAPDPSNWGFDIGHGQDGWGNQEVQYYTNNAQNVRVEDGRLIIQAIKDQNGRWTSARVKSQGKKNFTFGRIVWRAKLPEGAGTWAALWLLGENINSVGWPASGEIDVMEHVGKWQGQVLSAVHTPSSFGNTMNKSTTQIEGVHTAFHIYELLWTPEKLAFYVDGQNFYTYAPPVKNAQTWPFNDPAFLIMNIAMGGGLGSDPQFETGGLRNGIDPALAMAKMEVDYVRVYQAFNELKLTGPGIVQKNQTGLAFKTNNLAGASYEWRVPSGAVIVSGQGTSEANVNWGETEGIVSVSVSLNGATYEKEIAVTHVTKPQGSVFPLNAPDFRIAWRDADPVNDYRISEEEGSTRIDYHVTTPSSTPSLKGTLHRAVDLTDHPVLEVRARSFNKSRTLRMRVDLVDEHGNTTNKPPVFNLSPLIDDGVFYNYRFDFGEMNQWRSENGTVDHTRITEINVFVDFGVFGSAGSDSVWIENIQVRQRQTDPITNRPSHLTGTLEGTSVVLTWQDNAHDEAQFNIYYAVARDGPYSLIETTAANVTTVDIPFTVEDPFQFFFKVSASGHSGETEFSNRFQLTQTVTSAEELPDRMVSVYPNPAQNRYVLVKLPDPHAKVTIFDAHGNPKLVLKAESRHLSLDLHALSAGIYWISISGNSGTITRKLLLQ